MNRYNFMLASGQFDLLKERAEQTGLSMSDHVRRALDLYLLGQPCLLLVASGSVAVPGSLSFMGRS